MNNLESFSNLNMDDLTFATWPYPYPNSLVPQSTHPDLTSTAGSYVPDFNADDMANLASRCVDTSTYVTYPTVSQNILDPWFTQALSIDTNSADSHWQPQRVGDPYWTGVAPHATDSVVATPDSGVSPTSTTAAPQDKSAWLSDFSQTPCTVPASSSRHEVVWPAPEHGANIFEASTYRAGRDASKLSWPIPVVSGHVASNATAIYAPTTALGKHRLEAEEPKGDRGLVGINTHYVPPKKRARCETPWIQKAKRSVAGTATTLWPGSQNAKIIDKPKEAGRGAERLATPSAHGFYHQSSLGPSFQQGCPVEPAHGKPSWVEGSVDGQAEHSIDSAIRQQQQEATRLFKIPPRLKPMYRMLLLSSLDDLARNAVKTIKCRLCPGTDLENFEQFKRHCRTAEAHPLEILFCNRCGDFFARCDSLKRHNILPPPECRKVTLEEAAEKRRVTKEEHKQFIQRLRHSLTMGGVIGRPFSEIIKEKYPGSSKKRK